MPREGMNRVVLIGNLGQDPEIRYGQSGKAILKLRLATTESFKGHDGRRQEQTEWHTVVVFGKRAEALNGILSKGRSICVEGSIQYRSWEDKDGNKRYATEIKALNIILLGGGGERRDRPQQNEFNDGAASFPDDDFADDQIPF